METRLRTSQKMEAVGRLAGGIAHDFNNLLTVMIGNASLLGDSHLDAGDRGVVEQVLAAAERAAALTRQLLAFSRTQVVQLRPLDINSVIGGFRDMLQRLIGENIQVELHLGSDIWPALADSGQVEQILMNLAINSRDAMPDGGRIVIQTETWVLDGGQERQTFGFSPGRYVRLLFSDTGTGMPEAVRDRIFEPFFTTKAEGKGTGLGLATVHGIVQQAGGHIAVYSEPGQGTTFTIYLPRTDKVDAPSVTLASPQPTSGGETILLVEDEPGLRKLTARILRAKGGYHVFEASKVEEALSVIDANPDAIDLILTDIVMPGISGSHLAALLAERRAGIKILFMSGYSEHVLVDNLLAQSGTAFLQKPFTPAVLLRALREILDA